MCCVSALALQGLGPTPALGQGNTIVYRQLSNPWPPPEPTPWDSSGYPMFSPWNGPLVLDLNFDGRSDVGFFDNDQSFYIYGLNGARVLTYPPIEPDVNSFLPVLASGSEIGPTPSNPSLIWRETIFTGPFDQPYSATYNYAVNEGYGGYWQGREGYTGVEFEVDGQTHYAWIRVGTPFEGFHGGYIYDYAYETHPGTPIFAGVVPEPSACFLLCFGLLVLAASSHHKTVSND
jgi:hypothetical protein